MSLIAMLAVSACGTPVPKPVDIFPEDNCSYCRMAFSDQRFASEIITDKGEALKFDDIGCMLNFTAKHTDIKLVGVFVKDYDSKAWIPYAHAEIVVTDIETPMGSGKVAFADSSRAGEFQRHHPVHTTTGTSFDQPPGNRPENGD